MANLELPITKTQCAITGSLSLCVDFYTCACMIHPTKSEHRHNMSSAGCRLHRWKVLSVKAMHDISGAPGNGISETTQRRCIAYRDRDIGEQMNVSGKTKYTIPKRKFSVRSKHGPSLSERYWPEFQVDVSIEHVEKPLQSWRNKAIDNRNALGLISWAHSPLGVCSSASKISSLGLKLT